MITLSSSCCCDKTVPTCRPSLLASVSMLYSRLRSGYPSIGENVSLCFKGSNTLICPCFLKWCLFHFCLFVDFFPPCKVSLKRLISLSIDSLFGNEIRIQVLNMAQLGYLHLLKVRALLLLELENTCMPWLEFLLEKSFCRLL